MQSKNAIQRAFEIAFLRLLTVLYRLKNYLLKVRVVRIELTIVLQ